MARRAGLLLVMLLGATVACTLRFGADDGDSPPPGAVGTSRAAPSVRVIAPESGVRVPANQPLDITVATDSTATSFLMSVGGRVATTKALPPDQTGPAQAILTWTPDRQGTFTVEIVAFNGSAASAPATLLVEVSGVASGPGAGTGTACVGRVVVDSLNFREGPGTSAARRGQFALGELVTVVGRNADTSWWQVQRANGELGWVINNGQWLQVSGTCDGLPVAG
jgi:hypothetical protein